jgi:hypothetical protein
MLRRQRAARYVVCPLFDPSADVLRVKLLGPLPHHSLQLRRADKPWELLTAGGRWCKLYVGPPTIRVSGFRVSYNCDPGWLLGTPHRGKTWTANFAPGIGPGAAGRVNLVSAWC